MADHTQVPDFSYRPIRASITAGLKKEMPRMSKNRLAEMTTDVCMGLAVLADGKQQLWLDTVATDATEREDLAMLAMAQEGGRVEIAAIRTLTATLTAAGLALGFPAALVQERINAKLCRELFELPSRTR